MNRINAILVLLIVAFTTMGLVLLLYNTFTTIGIQDIEMNLQVKKGTIGIAVDAEKLTFGSIMPGGSATKKMRIGNDHDFPIAVSFTPLGEIKKYISVSENPALLDIGETKEIFVVAEVPSDMPYGNYTGIMRVIFTKVRE